MELRGEDDGAPLAVTDRHRARRVIIAANASAYAQGIAVGHDATAALVREPALRLVDRAPSREVRALKALAAWAIQFSADVCLDESRWLLWLEVGGSVNYFHGLDALRARIIESLGTLGYTARFGIAPTLESAALLSRELTSTAILSLNDLRAALDTKPLVLLALPPNVLSHLQASGLQNVGEVASLPPASLSRRFGAEVPAYLRRLLGELADPRPRFRVPDRYRRQYECAYPVATVEGLLFPLRRLLQELQGFLRGRDNAIQLLTITLRHRDAADTVLEIRTTSPQREAIRLFALLRERLERTNLPEPVTDIRLAAEQLLAPAILQTDLFDEGERLDAGWIALLDKLRARLGSSAVRQLGLADDHRPERAWFEEITTDGVNAEDLPHRPLWLLEPKPIERLPALCGTPERIEAGWWSGEDSSRDYYLARTPEGARWWLYKDARTQRWFLQGIWG
ncbi:MAG: DNA polymerase Y family protein [Gammaproteobacteria bacterium]